MFLCADTMAKLASLARDDCGNALRYLGATPLIDADHPDIRVAARGITAHAGCECDGAVAIHDFVRDHVVFGFTSSLHDMKASEVLECRLGYSLTKGTLFVAMLRAAGIPARLRFMEIHSDLVRGILVTNTPFVAHCVAEVWLEGRWIRTDSYVVDPGLLANVRRRLGLEAALLGYGAHRRGTSRWDGKREAFSQLVSGSACRISGRDFGILEDARQFQDQCEVLLGPGSVPSGIALSVASLGANGRIERIRHSGD
jgi:hypothetical protein